LAIEAASPIERLAALAIEIDGHVPDGAWFAEGMRLCVSQRISLDVAFGVVEVDRAQTVAQRNRLIVKLAGLLSGGHMTRAVKIVGLAERFAHAPRPSSDPIKELLWKLHLCRAKWPLTDRQIGEIVKPVLESSQAEPAPSPCPEGELR
jgi:hypothetical protein